MIGLIVYFVPFGLVLIIALFVLGAAGVAVGTVAEWLFTHIVPITIIFWALLFLVVWSMADRGKKVYFLSYLALFVTPFIIEIRWLNCLIWYYHKNLFEFVMFALLGGVYILPLLPLLPSLLVMWASSSINGSKKHPATGRKAVILLNLVFSGAYVLISGPLGKMMYPTVQYEMSLW